MKEFFKKFWHFVVIGVLSAAILTMIIVMSVCMTPKGKGGEGGGEGGTPEIVTFDAPANVKVEGKTLTWNATEGASNGYTVKINDYEMITGGTSLSLASATVTARLNYGDNTLAVRVNAIYNKEKSAYSAAVTYTYNLPENVRTFLALVGELGDDEKAEGLEAKITAAETAYAALTEEEQGLEEVKEVKTQFDSFKAKYTAYTAAQAFAAKVEAIDITAADADDKITEAEDAYGELSLAAKDYVKEDYATLNSKKTERATYKEGVTSATAEFTALKTAIANFKANGELSADEKNEAIIAAIEAKQEFIAGVDENVKANTEVAALLNEIDTEDTTAKGAIVTMLGGLKTSVEEALADTTPNETNYNALMAEEDKLNALGDYAKSQFAVVFEKSFDTVKTNLAGAKTVMVNTLAETIVSDSVSTNGATRMIYITVQFKNFKGEPITEMNNPPVVTLNKTGTGNATIEQQLTKSATGAYVAIIKMEPFADITSASYSIAGIASAQNKPIDVTPVLGNNPFFTTIEGDDGFREAFDETGIKLNDNGFTGVYSNGKLYLEIYENGAITKSGDFAAFNGSPIVGKDGMTRIDVTTWGNADKMFEVFNRHLALNYGDYFIGETRSVHFVIYGEAEVDGATSRTAVKADTVSSAKEFKLTDDDRYYGLLSTGKNGAVSNENIWFSTVAVMGMMADGSGEVAQTGYSLNGLLSKNGKTYQFEKVDDSFVPALKQNIGIRLTMIGTINGEAWKKVLYLDLGETYKIDDLVKLCSLDYYKANPNVTANITVSDLTFKACYHVREDAHTDVKALFKLSREWDVTGLSDSMELNRASISTPAAIAPANEGTWVIIVRDLENKFGGNGTLLTSGKAKYVKYEFYNKETPDTKYTMYLFLNNGNVEFYKEINEDGTPKGNSFTLLQYTVSNDAGVPLDQFKTNLEAAFDNAFVFTGNWIFADQYVLADSTQDYLPTVNVTEFEVSDRIAVVTPASEGSDD